MSQRVKNDSAALITIRHGHTISAIHEGELAQAYLERHLLHSLGERPGNIRDHDDLLAKTFSVPREVLQLLVKRFPLQGLASRCFSTAFRADVVRQSLQPLQVRGVSILQVLGSIFRAADAHRLLTIPILDETLAVVGTQRGANFGRAHATSAEKTPSGGCVAVASGSDGLFGTDGLWHPLLAAEGSRREANLAKHDWQPRVGAGWPTLGDFWSVTVTPSCFSDTSCNHGIDSGCRC